MIKRYGASVSIEKKKKKKKKKKRISEFLKSEKPVIYSLFPPWHFLWIYSESGFLLKWDFSGVSDQFMSPAFCIFFNFIFYIHISPPLPYLFMSQEVSSVTFNLSPSYFYSTSSLLWTLTTTTKTKSKVRYPRNLKKKQKNTKKKNKQCFHKFIYRCHMKLSYEVGVKYIFFLLTFCIFCNIICTIIFKVCFTQS